MTFLIEPMVQADWAAVQRIYREGIETGHATFETETPSWEYWDEGHLTACRLVARDGSDVIGWAALLPVSHRPVYSGVAEVSVYVGSGARGKGVGSALLKEAVSASEEAGIWTLVAGIFPENGASLALHKSCGFRERGVRVRIGKMAGVWRDVVVLERRSNVVGVD